MYISIFIYRKMILEVETYDAFGYYARDLKPHSRKPIFAACDECGKVRETRKCDYRALCPSCVKKGKNNPNFGKHFTEEHKNRLRDALKGKKHTKEAKALMSAAHKGKIFTEEHRANLSASHIGIQAGENSPHWQGGISFEPYCVKFNEAFKEYIRAKFGYTCFLCPTTQAENGRKLSVHHVNYNKNCGCDGDKTCQFVPLCISCHTKTNFNRDYWEKLITNKLHLTIIGWAV